MVKFCVLDTELEDYPPAGIVGIIENDGKNFKYFFYSSPLLPKRDYVWGMEFHKGENFEELETYLKEFDGVIVGFNIFKKDYSLLAEWINLDKVIEKTFDICLFLRWKSKFHKMYSLNDLAKCNFNQEKLPWYAKRKGYRRGFISRIIRYNRHDCYLTSRLYLKMVNLYPIITPQEKIEMEKRDLRYILNYKPMITYSQFLKSSY